MAIDFTTYAVVRGFAPYGSRETGGNFAEGELGKMIPIAMEYSDDKRFNGVNISFGNADTTWWADEIKGVSDGPDFAEWRKAAGG